MDWQPPIKQLERVVLASLGLVPALLLGACGGAPPQHEDEGGVTTEPSGDGSSLGDDGTSGGTSGGTSMTTTTGPDPTDTTDTTDDGGPKWDLPPLPDMPPLGDCTVTLAEPGTLEQHPECPIELGEPSCLSEVYWGCVPLEPGQTCARQCVEGDCVEDWMNCAGDMIYDMPYGDVCGPYERDGMCCSLAEFLTACADGRPFVVDGQARTPALLAGEARKPAELPAELRGQLADRWAASARAEHASIASFAAFAGHLLALAAPPSLIREALAAAADESRHAELARARASCYAGRELAFGPLDTRRAGGPPPSLELAVLACVREGCIGETLAALELATAAGHCRDPKLAATLRAIADDESRHAALAWRFVDWAVRRTPSLGPKVAALFDAIDVPPTEDPDQPDFSPDERATLRAHGCLPPDERRQLLRHGLRELVRPCARALLGSCSPAHVATGRS